MPVKGHGINKKSGPAGESRGTNIHQVRKQSVKRGKNSEKRTTSRSSKPPCKAIAGTPAIGKTTGNSGPTNQLANF